MPLSTLAPSTRQALAEGARRFAEGRYFEAHEVWEDAWRVERGELRQLLQGLIQVAAGFHKGLSQRRPAGMARLLAAGLTRLDGLDGLGLVDLVALRADASAWLAAARSWADGGAPPVLPSPAIHLS